VLIGGASRLIIFIISGTFFQKVVCATHRKGKIMLERVPIARESWIDLDKVTFINGYMRDNWVSGTSNKVPYLSMIVDTQFVDFKDDECAIVMKMIERKYDEKC